MSDLKSTEEYLKSANLCPISGCGSSNIEGGSVSIEGQYAVQEVACLDCGAVWVDEYQLKGYRLISKD